MKLKRKIDWDAYFSFLEEYFSLFDFSNIERKKIKGRNFKL
jgi:hypothetical protein